jgi:hypothetical protein
MGEFTGFRPLSANFTPTPNQYFEQVLGHQPYCVAIVVGILIRSTLGWEDPVTGERRQEAELSLSAFLRPELSEASARTGLKKAIEAGFIVRTASATAREGARYALRWADGDAQRAAIERARRANADPLLTDSIRGLKSRPLKTRGLKSAPPYIEKKRSPEKKNVLALQEEETLNVRGHDLYQTLETDSDAEAVRLVVGLTRDGHSVRRFTQLREICTDHGKTGCWTEALRSTERAIKRGTVESDKRGAYFCAAVVRQLERKGVTVPSGTPEERQDIHTLITASLGAALVSEDCP